MKLLLPTFAASACFVASAIAAPDLGAILGQPIIDPSVPTVEVQVFTSTRVPALPPATTAGAWESEAERLRRRVIDDVILRGEAKRWRAAQTRVEWLDTIETNHGYRIRKVRFEALPGLWIPALLYEPSRLSGKVAAVLNLNGHERTGNSTAYIQERCINLAKRGILALNPEWLGRGQLTSTDLSHYRAPQLDLCGTSGLAVFYLAMVRSLDLLLSLPQVDAGRVAVTGLSGGGWQTIVLSALDPRVRLANPVAGYSSYVTRTQFPALDLGDYEQTPSDLATVVDYTHLTAMVAPRPLLLTYNALDTCCFVAANSLPPLVHAVRPVFALFKADARFRQHVNFDPGHNYGADNREAFYAMLRDHLLSGDPGFPLADIPSQAEVRTAEQLAVSLPPGNQNFHTLALALSEGLPRAGAPDRARLAEIVRAPRYRVAARQVGTATADGLEITRWRLKMNDEWTVPVIEIAPANPQGTVVLVADAGRASAATYVQQCLDRKQRVVAVDPFYFGESKIPKQAGLFAILIAAVGERPLGIQAGQVGAVARWLGERRLGPVTVASLGPRSSLFALIAAALDPDAVAALDAHEAMSSLKEVITRNLSVDQRPEQFCFGLLQEFDLPQLTALAQRSPPKR